MKRWGKWRPLGSMVVQRTDVDPVEPASAIITELTEDPLDPRQSEGLVAFAGAGAICTFSGVVRDNTDGIPATHLDYEAYVEMAKLELDRIGREIVRRWPGARASIVHRLGTLQLGEVSVVVSVAHAHRDQAFEACQFGIETLKETVPIWKKEFRPNGAVWIEGPNAIGVGPSAKVQGRSASESRVRFDTR